MNLTVPNLLSLLRMGLLPLFVIAVFQRQPERALLLFIAAGITDLLDGLIARYLDQKSPLGAYLDPIADKLLLVTSFVILSIPGLNPGLAIPIWITVLVIARDVLILTIAALIYLAVGLARFPPTPLSKVNTGFQIAGILLVLLTGVSGRFDQLALLCLYAVAGLTVVTGLDYIYRANKMVEAKPSESGSPAPSETPDRPESP